MNSPKSITPRARPNGFKFVAIFAALLMTLIVFGGYAYLRSRHSSQVRSTSTASQAVHEVKGPPKAHILVDEALLKGSQTIIGGEVKNISNESLRDLAVIIELKRRQGGGVEQMSVLLERPDLEPEESARYTLTLPARDFGSVRLVGLKGSPNGSPVQFTTGAGQKRPPERLEPKTIIVPRHPPSHDEFLNSPDNPGRVS